VDLWDERLGLRPVGGGATIPLRMANRAVTTSVATLLHIDATPVRPPADRRLYDLVHDLGNGRQVVVSPHCVYAASSWQRFDFMHITDMHVSSRNDEMQADADAIGVGAEYVNFNDGLRETILTANRLHDAGMLDVLFATGDLVDFSFDEADDRSGGGNFQLLVDPIRGAVQAGGQHMVVTPVGHLGQVGLGDETPVGEPPRCRRRTRSSSRPTGGASLTTSPPSPVNPP